MLKKALFPVLLAALVLAAAPLTARAQKACLMPGIWHAFWGDGGDVLIGEVSTVNDDWADNIFQEDDQTSAVPQRYEAQNTGLGSDKEKAKRRALDRRWCSHPF